MKTYEAVFTENPEHGVFGISCVERPAMQDTWITLSEQPRKIVFDAVDEEKQILLGAILIPNKKVYRKDGDEEFYLTFTADTIEKVSHSYLKRGNQRNSWENHQTQLEDVSLVETWTVTDPEKDKSAAYGKKYEKGTWVGMMHVDKETYGKAKEGKLTGFSIDAIMPLKEVNFNIQDMSDFKKAFADVLKDLGLSKEIKMGQLKLSDKKTTIHFEGDKPEIGQPVFLIDDEGVKNRVPEGTLELESGEKLNIDKDGLVAEAAKEEEKAEAVSMAQVTQLFEKFALSLSETIGGEFDKMKKDHEAALKLRDEKIEALKKEIAEPASTGITFEAEEIKEPKTSKERLMNASLMALKSN